MSKLLYFLYSISNKLYRLHIPILPKLIQVLIRLVFGCYIPYSAQIGKNTLISYGGIGIVIHSRCIIGKNCILSPGVVLGGTNHKYNVPKLGNNVLVGTGAKIIGSVEIGDNVVIGANAVVTENLPSNTLAVGIPAKVIKDKINIKNYM